MKLFKFVVLFFIIISSYSTFSQTPESPMDSLKTFASHDGVEQGGSINIALEVFIKTGWHLNSPKPLQDYLIPTVLRLESEQGMTQGETIFPPHKLLTFAFSEEPLAVFEGKITVFSSISVPLSATPGVHTVKGFLEYQACAHDHCIMPESKEFSIVFNVVPKGTSINAINNQVFSAMKGSYSSTTDAASGELGGLGAVAGGQRQERSKDELEALNWIEKGFFVALGFFFLTGLSLNLTPCVFPVIPLTISYFGGQSGKSRAGSFASAFTYAIGIAAMFTVLGLLSSLAGKTWGGLFQNPWFVAGLALIMLVLAASMFGVFEIMLPSFIMNRVGTSRQGFIGAFIMGLTAGIIIAPCAAGIIIGLITLVASSGMVLKGTILFFAMGFGLGLPYIVLGTFSGLLNKLPQSGMWMVWVRKVFGLILIGVAIYFLVPHAQTLGNQFYYWGSVLAVFSGLLLGFLEHSGEYSRAFNVGRRLFALAIIIVGLAGFNKSLQSFAGAGIHSPEIQNGLVWESYEATTFERHISLNRPIFMDFTAAWCAKCKELEYKSFPDPEVVELLKKFTLIRVDLTNRKNPGNQDIEKKFNIRGLPTLIFIDSEGKERKELRQTSFVKPDVLASLLKETLKP